MLNIGTVLNGASRIIGRCGLVASKYAPEILTGVGVVGVVSTAVLASKATLGLSDVVDEAKKDLAAIESVRGREDYSEQMRAKDIAIVYVRTARSVTALYAPTLIAGAITIGCFLGSTKILRSRNAALAAAYKMLDAQYKKYRQRVREDHGDEVERSYHLGAKLGEVEVIEDGKAVTLKDETVFDSNSPSVYARFFDETSTEWERDADYNLTFLKFKQSQLNDKLRQRGHMFLNEVYDELGLKRSTAGQVVGWLYEEGQGDHYIDFGIYDLFNDRKRAFVNGVEKSILLDFNVDGPIHNLI